MSFKIVWELCENESNESKGIEEWRRGMEEGEDICYLSGIVF